MNKQIKRLPWPVVSRLIDVWIWDARDRAILKDKMYNNPSYEMLAEQNHLSVQRTKEIVKDAKEVLFSHIPQKYFS